MAAHSANCGGKASGKARPQTRAAPVKLRSAGPNSAHNSASVIRNCKQLTCCLWQHSYNSCYAHNRPSMGRWAASATSTGGTGGRHLRPTAERPATRPPCWPGPGRAVCREINGISGRNPATVLAGSGLRQSRAAPLRGPPPPPIPPSGGAAWAASACAGAPQPRAGSRRVRLSRHSTKPFPGINQNREGFFQVRVTKPHGLPASTDAGPRTARGSNSQWLT